VEYEVRAELVDEMLVGFAAERLEMHDIKCWRLLQGYLRETQEHEDCSGSQDLTLSSNHGLEQ
jgi:hypothetical protein